MPKINTNDSTRYFLYILTSLHKYCEKHDMYFHSVVPGNFPMESHRESIAQFALYPKNRPSPFYIYVVASYKSMSIPDITTLPSKHMRVKASHVSSIWLWDWTNASNYKKIHQHINDYKDIDTFFSMLDKEVL